MAKTQQKDIFAQVRDLGSEALHRLADVPGGSKLVEMANETRSRLDEMQKKLRGLDELEKRVAKLERQLAAQTTKTATTARKTTARKTTSARRATTPKKPPA
jgi:predicted phage gp36 major capsid-like protein